MSFITDLTAAEFCLMGLNMLLGCFALSMTLLAGRRLDAQACMPDAL